MEKIIRICMGSACHAKGAPAIVKAFESILQERGLENEIQLMGRFCKGQCHTGVNVEVGPITYENVKEEDIPYLINQLLEG